MDDVSLPNKLLEVASEAGDGVRAISDKFGDAYNAYKRNLAEKQLQKEADDKFLLNPVYKRPIPEQTPELQQEEQAAQHRQAEDALESVVGGAPIGPPRAITKFLGEQAKKVITPRLQAILERGQAAYDPKTFAKARDIALESSEPLDLKKTAEVAGILPHESPQSAYQSSTTALGDELARKYGVKSVDRDGLIHALGDQYPASSLALGENMENVIIPKNSKEYYKVLSDILGKDHQLVRQGSGGVATTNEHGMPQIIIHPSDDPKHMMSVLSHEGQHIEDRMLHPDKDVTNVYSVDRLIDDIKGDPRMAQRVLRDLENSGVFGSRQAPKDATQLANYLRNMQMEDSVNKNLKAGYVLSKAQQSKNELINSLPSTLERLLAHTKGHHIETPKQFELERLMKLLNDQKTKQ